MGERLIWLPIPIEDRLTPGVEPPEFPRHERLPINPAFIEGEDVLVLRGFGITDALTGLPALRALHRWVGGAGRLVLACDPTVGRWLQSWGVVDAVCSVAKLRTSPPRAGGHLAIDLLTSGAGGGRELLRATGARDVIGFAAQSRDRDTQPRSRGAQRRDRPAQRGDRTAQRGGRTAHDTRPSAQGRGRGVGPVWSYHEHPVLRWSRLAESLGAEPTLADLALQDRPQHTDDRRLFARRERPGFVVIHPGAAIGSRQWGARRWISVGRRLEADGRRIVVTGSRKERALCAEVTAGIGGRVTDLSGRLPLAGLTELVAAAALVLSTDTGISHLATATVTPSVTLFGPVPPSESGPLIDLDLHTVLWAGDQPDSRGDVLSTTIDPRLDLLRPLHVLTAARAQLARRRTVLFLPTGA